MSNQTTSEDLAQLSSILRSATRLHIVSPVAPLAEPITTPAADAQPGPPDPRVASQEAGFLAEPVPEPEARPQTGHSPTPPVPPHDEPKSATCPGYDLHPENHDLPALDDPALEEERLRCVKALRQARISMMLRLPVYILVTAYLFATATGTILPYSHYIFLPSLLAFAVGLIWSYPRARRMGRLIVRYRRRIGDLQYIQDDRAINRRLTGDQTKED